MGNSTIGEFFVNQDIFGHKIGVNYRGQDAYKTGMGATCTFLTYLLLLINLEQLISGYLDTSSKMSLSTQRTTIAAFNEPAFNLADNKVELAVMNFFGDGIPRDVGRVRLFQAGDDCDLTETSISECLENQSVVRVESTACYDSINEKVENYYSPRFGPKIIPDLLDAMTCYDSSGLAIESE